MIHIPVLKDEVIKFLDPKPNENFVDATIDGGGHAEEILKKISPNGKLLGIELNQDLLNLVRERLSTFKNRLVLAEDNFANVDKIVNDNKFLNISGILFDLGISNFYLEQSESGISFKKVDQKLDMRFSQKQNLTAADILNNFGEDEMYEIFKNYGEEKFSRQIAKNVASQRRIKKFSLVEDLNGVIRMSVPEKLLSPKIFARIFQALRITVNDELNSLKMGLSGAYSILNKGGKIVVISYHSLEDRIVKNFLRDMKNDGKMEILTKKPQKPLFSEIKQNPKSRSAKLRAAIKI